MKKTIAIVLFLAVAAASAGDTVLIPADTATWSSQLSLTNGICLIGAGSGSTVIVSGYTRPTPVRLATTSYLILWK